jgi:hypothetical protein
MHCNYKLKVICKVLVPSRGIEKNTLKGVLNIVPAYFPVVRRKDGLPLLLKLFRCVPSLAYLKVIGYQGHFYENYEMLIFHNS